MEKITVVFKDLFLSVFLPYPAFCDACVCAHVQSNGLIYLYKSIKTQPIYWAQYFRSWVLCAGRDGGDDGEAGEANFGYRPFFEGTKNKNIFFQDKKSAVTVYTTVTEGVWDDLFECRFLAFHRHNRHT